MVGEPRVRAPVEVRLAEPGDLSALVSLSLAAARSDRVWAGRGWTPPDSVTARQLWWDRLRDAGSWVAVAAAGFTRVGCAMAWPAPTLQGRPPELAYMSGPLVDPEWWGEGVGSALLDSALEALVERRFTRAELAIPAGNRRGCNFLEQHGWFRAEPPARISPTALVLYGVHLERPPIENRSQYAA